MDEYQIIDSEELPKYLSEGWQYFCPCRPYGIDRMGIWVKRISSCSDPQVDPLHKDLEKNLPID
jgi:hypothetical protein